MLSFSPIKLLIVLVVAAILVGPDKLPQVGRQLGAAWRTFRSFHEKVEQEVRRTIPDLPSSGEIARLARSPVAFLNQLANSSGPEPAVPDPAAPDPADGNSANGSNGSNGANGAVVNGAAANGAPANGNSANGSNGSNGANGNSANGAKWPIDGAAQTRDASPAGAPASPTPAADPSMN